MASHRLSVFLVVVFYMHLGMSEECRHADHGFIEIGESITITSPNYPNPTPGNCFSEWFFSSPENSIINLYCSDFDIPGINQECIDKFEFSYFPSTSGNGLQVEYCGERNLELNTTHNKFHLTFRSIPDDIVHPGLILYHSKRRFNCTFTALGTNLATKGCGKNHLHNRVVGGENAQLHEWPWMVALRNQTDHQVCGGSLILTDWVLTAAHCFDYYHKEDIYVSIGDHNLYTGEDTPHTVHPSVSQLIIHYRYNHMYNDIALLKLANPVEYSYAINPVCLPSHLRSKSFAREKVISTGWGQTSKLGLGSDDLLEVDLQVLTNEDCNRRAQINRMQPIYDHQICAYKEEKSSCHGDSGGPLVWLDDNGRYQLVGIVSHGLNWTACVAKDSATVYTRVTSYINWIEEKTNPSICSN